MFLCKYLIGVLINMVWYID